MFCFLNFIFNWRIITLQHYVGFCHTSPWISHRHTRVPYLSNIPPTLLGCHRALALGFPVSYSMVAYQVNAEIPIFSCLFLNYESTVTHLQETWKIQNKVTYGSTIYTII